MAPLDWMDAREGTAEPAPSADTGDALLEELNPPQRDAVVHGEGPLLILAGAGSGKTRVITRRIAWLVATGRARPHEILAITFTNKAAREMRERVLALLPGEGLWISTFHAMCARILRRDIEVLGPWTRNFSIYDTHDKNQLLKSVVKALGYDTQRFRPSVLGAWISSWKTEPYEAEGEASEPHGIDERVFRQVRERYEEELRKNDALDFDDLLVRVLELFEREPGLRDAYAHRFRYVLVDEYQDTNRIQYLLTRHLASAHGNLAVCGDPDQSIYAWRGADIRNILDFERDFATPERPVRVVRLERNYRSTRPILEAAQAVIRCNRERKEKELWTDRESDVPVRVVTCADENDEAGEVVRTIHARLAQGRRADEIAVFYRVNFMQRALERALRLGGVAYQVLGGPEFYQRREVRDLVAWLQLVANPRDELALRRVINVPGRGVGEKSVGVLAQWAAERGVPLVEATRSPDARSRIRGRARAGVAEFARIHETLLAQLERPAAEALEHVLEETDYLAWLARSSEPDAEQREENVAELLAHAAAYDRESPEGGVTGFLQDVALVSDVDVWEENTPKVTLMTLHASKGLEFPIVFICGLEEELLPHALALQEGGLEEERRLFYVGMTRAKDELVLTHARMRLHYGETSYRMPSRFLAELPESVGGTGGGAAGGVRANAAAEEPLGAYEAPPEAPELHAGDRVEHDHFGLGRIVDLQGSGSNARATVDFGPLGRKVLLVQYANLQVVGR